MDQSKINFYCNEPAFIAFVNNEFDKVALESSIEELAEFAFGSIEDAIRSYTYGE